MSRKQRERFHKHIPLPSVPLTVGGAINRDWYQFWADSRTLESGEQAITNGTTLLLPHRQNDAPAKVWAVLRCKTAELGHEVDDEVCIPAFQDAAANYGVSLIGSALNLIVTVGSSGIRIMDRTGGSVGTFTAITTDRWRIVVRARF